jgi:hypothetical protein
MASVWQKVAAWARMSAFVVQSSKVGYRSSKSGAKGLLVNRLLNNCGMASPERAGVGQGPREMGAEGWWFLLLKSGCKASTFDADEIEGRIVTECRSTL